MSEAFYLRDSRGDTGSSAMFWAASGGYTTDLNRAEKFTRENAVGQYNSRETDLPLRCDLVDHLSYRAVDCQYIEGADCCDHSNCYVIQVTGAWDGNNIMFVSIEGGHTYDYDKAKLVGGDHRTELSDGHVMLSKEALDKIARPVVKAARLQTALILKLSGIKHKKPKRVRVTTGKTRHNCPGCAKFVWDYSPYDAPFCRACR
jgi:hypothetical protein